MKSNELLSVVILAYNHELYIKECLDGVLKQQTDFDFDVIVHDDASIDGTVEIIKRYKEKYPNLFKTIFQKENQFSKDRAVFSNIILPKIRSKYIAICEGDDFWTDPNKLQKQVDFLEKKPNYVMAFHDVNVLQNKNNNKMYNYARHSKQTLFFNDLLFKMHIPTCSLMIRRSIIPKPFPEWISNCLMEDTPIKLLISDKGKSKYFPEKMATYRRHDAGITNSKEQVLKGRASYLLMYKKLRKHLGLNRYLPLTFMIVKTQLGKYKNVLRQLYFIKNYSKKR